MAKCTNKACKIKILWDWDNDRFCFESGDSLEFSPVVINENKGETFSCICGCEVGTVYDDGSVTDTMFKNLGFCWAQKENSFTEPVREINND